MKLSEVRKALSKVSDVKFRLPDGQLIPQHFHVTEVGLVTKHFIDCGGTERTDVMVNFQLWEAEDFDHRLEPGKFLHILDLSKKVSGDEDYEVEVEYQQSTIGKFGLGFDGIDFILTNKHTACLAEDLCGIPAKQKITQSSCCSPETGCC